MLDTTEVPHRGVSPAALLLCVVGAAAACHRGSGGSGGFLSPAGSPRARGIARYFDVDGDGQAGAGDRVAISFDVAVSVVGSDPSQLMLPVDLDTFGVGARLVAGPRLREVSVVLGAGARLRTRGRYSDADLDPGAPSGVGISVANPPTIVNRATGAGVAPTPPFDIVPGFIGDGEFLAPGAFARGELVAETNAVGAADLDRDGDTDLVLAYTAGGIAIAIGDGTGEFEVLPSQLPGVAALALDLGDVDRDGRDDIVLGTAGPDVVLRNRTAEGSYVFEVAQDDIGARRTEAVSLVDMDRDGDLDLVTADEDGGRVYLLVGPAGFEDSGQLLGAAGWRSLATGDFDGDTLADALFAGDAGIELWRGDGTGQLFAERTTITSEVSTALSVADVDADGDLDFAAAGASRDRLWLGDGRGAFTDAGTNLGASPSHALALIDLDADGRSDLVQSTAAVGGLQAAARALRMRFNDGAGGFVDSQQQLAQGSTACGLTLADLDGDSDPDLIAALCGEPPRIFRHSLSGTWGALEFRSSDIAPFGNRGLTIAGADLVRDGRIDLVGGAGNTIEVHAQAPDGSFTALAPIPLEAGASLRDLALGDVDGDGNADIVAALIGVGSAVWLGQGAGSFALWVPDVPDRDRNRFRATGVGDVDRDGDEDWILGSTGGLNEVRRNAGGFGDAWLGFEPALLIEPSGLTNELVLGDLDGDGDLDLVTASGEGEENGVFLNDGTGSFTRTTDLGVSRTRALALADLDGDGDLDVLAGYGSALGLWENSGSAAFTLADSLAFEGVQAIAAGDLDADGNVDLAVGTDTAIQLLPGREGLALGTPIEIPQPGVLDLLIGDANGDGDLDLAVGTVASMPNWVWQSR